MVTTTTGPTYDLQQVENDLSAVRGQVNAFEEYAEIATMVGTAVAVAPGTSTEPQTQATWQYLTAPSGWTFTNVGYKLYPDATVGLCGTIATPSSGSYNATTLWTMPTAYQPLNNKWLPITASNNNTGFGANAGSPGLPRLEVSAASMVQLAGLPVSYNSNTVNIDGIRYPLDT